MNKPLTACCTLLVLGCVAASAQDVKPDVMHINGGSTTIATKKSLHQPVRMSAEEPAALPFYNNIGTGGYQPYMGYTACDGVSSCGAEWTPANQFKSLKTGTTSKITLGLGFIQGTNRALVILTSSCNNLPCTNPDGSPSDKRLCQGTVKNMPIFSDTNTQVVSFKCVAHLTKRKNYWVLIQSPSASDLAWNFSLSATGGVVLGQNDTWDPYEKGQPTGALKVQ